jgi:hypothetical protein
LKTKRDFIIFILIIMLLSNYSLIPINAAQEYDKNLAVQSLSRLQDLNIFDRNIGNLEAVVNRGLFSKAIIIAAGLEGAANSLSSNYSILDVQPDSEFSGFINAAVEKGFMNVMSDDKFYPERDVTFAQACTILVRALGYSNKDVLGAWPMNYINMAAAMGLTKCINLEKDQSLPLWAAAIMFERLLDTNIKPTSATAVEKDFHDYTELFIEIVIWDNSHTSDKLLSNQVLTDKGVFTIQSQEMILELGNKYRVKLEDNKIKKIFTKIGLTEKRTVNSGFNEFELPGYVSYYYHGAKQSYETLKNIFKANSTLILGCNPDDSSYEYGVIFDPVYSDPVTAVKTVNSVILAGEIGVNDKDTMIKDGEAISKTDINSGDMVYEVTNIFGEERYILVVGDKAEGEVTDIYPDKVHPTSLFIDNKKYELGKYVNLRRINVLELEDKVSAVLGYDGKIVDISKITYKSGPFVECMILGNSKTSDNLSEKQVLTDKGVFYNMTSTDFELGNTYTIVIDGDSIVLVDEAMEKLTKITVSRIMDATVNYMDGDYPNSIVLPKIPYYYHGAKQDYNAIKNALQANSAVVFAENESKSGYKYGVIFDPVYGAPKINDGLLTNYNNNYDYRDVIYEVTDIWGKHPLTVGMDNRITGLVTAIYPNRDYPKTIQVGGKNYDLSQYFDFNKTSYFNSGNRVNLILGYDGKVVDMY